MQIENFVGVDNAFELWFLEYKINDVIALYEVAVLTVFFYDTPG